MSATILTIFLVIIVIFGLILHFLIFICGNDYCYFCCLSNTNTTIFYNSINSTKFNLLSLVSVIQDQSLLLSVTFKLMKLFMNFRSSMKVHKIYKGYLAKKSPAKHLIVFVFVGLFNTLIWIHVL